MVVGVALDKLNIDADALFDYEADDAYAKPGIRVAVPFGNGNKLRNGIIVELRSKKQFDGKLKEISKYIDSEPILTAEMLALCSYISERCFCTFYDAVKTLLPAATRMKLLEICTANDGFEIDDSNADEIYKYLLKHKSCEFQNLVTAFGKETLKKLEYLSDLGAINIEYKASQKVNDAYVKSVSLAVSAEEVATYLSNISRNREKHEKVLDVLIGCENVPFNELCYLAGVSNSVVDTLEKHGMVTISDIEVFRTPYGAKEKNTDSAPINLTTKQQLAYDGLLNLYELKTPQAALLYGITGSGKTLVYLKLIDKVIADGGNIIVLVPEISLTPQLTDRLFNRYGDTVAVQHSGMSIGERFDQWKRIKRGKAHIVLGTRSAIFAPFDKVSLIIVDEEQETTYKSENSPRYHARDIAKFRVTYNKGLLVLASATPSVESYAMASKGKYKFFEINERYGDGGLPKVIVSDLAAELKGGASGNFGETLIKEIRKNLENSEQTILFHNRRGYNTYIGCRDCGYVFTCPNCSISMTYHKANNMLMCHYCGHCEPVVAKCPQCSSPSIKYLGTGTQRIDDELKELFPTARTVRMDLDTTGYKMSHERILADFSDGKYDILIGTQMVTKGLDMPNVTLVGVLLADMMLYSEDFRCTERAFSMLTQVVGRAGRANKTGRAVIQTFNPHNNTVELAAKQNYKGFFDEEIAFRKILSFPPYCSIYLFSVSAENEQITKEAAEYVCTYLSDIFEKTNRKNVILYPSLPSALLKIGKKYRYRVMLKCKDDASMRMIVKKMLIDFHKNKYYKDITLSVDANPQMIL